MSFRCEECDIPQPPKTKVNRVVVETRDEGKQIAKEKNMCAGCAENFDTVTSYFIPTNMMDESISHHFVIDDIEQAKKQIEEIVMNQLRIPKNLLI